MSIAEKNFLNFNLAADLQIFNEWLSSSVEDKLKKHELSNLSNASNLTTSIRQVCSRSVILFTV